MLWYCNLWSPGRQNFSSRRTKQIVVWHQILQTTPHFLQKKLYGRVSVVQHSLFPFHSMDLPAISCWNVYHRILNTCNKTDMSGLVRKWCYKGSSRGMKINRRIIKIRVGKLRRGPGSDEWSELALHHFSPVVRCGNPCHWYICTYAKLLLKVFGLLSGQSVVFAVGDCSLLHLVSLARRCYLTLPSLRLDKLLL